MIRELIHNYNGDLADSCKLKNVSIGLVSLALNIAVVVFPFMAFYYVVFWCIAVEMPDKGHGKDDHNEGQAFSDTLQEPPAALRRRNPNAE